MASSISSLVIFYILGLVCTCGAREVSVSFDLVSDFTTECSVGHSENSTAVRLDYRELSSLDQSANWTTAGTKIINLDEICGFQSHASVDGILFAPDNFIQFRLLQLEHGGGTCNCWGASNFTMTIPGGPDIGGPIEVPIDFGQSCDKQPAISGNNPVLLGCERKDLFMESESVFCGGSANLPRGVVTALYRDDSTVNISLCDMTLEKSAVSDPKPSPLTCADTYPHLELTFHLDMLDDQSGPCRGPARFDEGVEVAVGGSGEWTPLSYTATSLQRNSLSNNIFLGEREENQSVVDIRGYSVPYNITDGGRQHTKSVRICGPLLKDAIQLRWLQTASFTSNNPVTNQVNWRDMWTLTDIELTLNVSQNTSTLVLSSSFNDSADVDLWGGEIRNGMMSSLCSAGGGQVLLMGSQCNTPGCGSGTQITASRQVSTMPLNLTHLLPQPPVTTPPTTIPPTTTPPTTIPPTTTPPSTTPPTTTPPTIPPTMFPTTIPPTTIPPTTPPTTTPPTTPPTMPPTTIPPTTPPMTTLPTTTTVDSGIAEIQDELNQVFMTLLDEIDESLQEILGLPPDESVGALENLIEGDDYEIDTTEVSLVMATAFQNLQNTTIENPMEFGEGVHSISDSIIDSSVEADMETEPDVIAGATLLSLFEQLTGDILETGQTIGSRRVMSTVMSVDLDSMASNDTMVPGLSMSGHSISLPLSVLRELGRETDSPSIRISSTYYQNMTGLLPGNLQDRNDSILASPVLSSALQCNGVCPNKFSPPVMINFSHTSEVEMMIENDENATVDCVYFEFIEAGGENPLSSGRWSTEGCTRNANLSSTSQTVCECEHLTNFAILLSAQPLNTTGAVALSLAIIGYIGVSLSVAAMTVTIFTLLFLRSLWSMRNFIHINLCVSLILAQLTFVVGVTPHEGGGEVGPGCRTAAVLIHYLFLVSFMWMLMEGVVLYIALVKVFVKNQIRYMVGFFIFSYGAPLLYMALCVPLAFAHFPRPEWGYGYSQLLNGNDTIVCWLNPHNGFVWSFIVPVILTILVNVGFFIMALVIMCRHSKKQTHKSRLDSAKHWIKGSISLVTLMGIAWIIGVLVLEVPALIPLAYIFTIVVAFQGVAIFLIFVVFSKQVREAYKKWWRIKVAESDILSKHFGEFSVTSNTTLTRTGASSPGYVSTGNGAVHSQIDSAYETSHFETSLTEPEKENLAHRRSTFCRQGTSFDVTFVPAPSKEAMSVELGAEVTPYQSTPNGRHDDGEMAPDTQDNVVFSDPETDITVL